MGLITCDCLNVRIFSKTDPKNAKAVAFDPPLEHAFFSGDGVHEVLLHIRGIHIEHNFLIEKTNYQRWVIHKCINCDTLTHAKHLDTDRTLARFSLLSDKSVIEELMAGPAYSIHYKIKVEKPVAARSTSMTVSRGVKKVLQSIQANCETFIEKEEVELAKRIREFEDIQRESFNEMKIKLIQEKNALLSTIVSNYSKNCHNNPPVDEEEEGTLKEEEFQAVQNAEDRSDVPEVPPERVLKAKDDADLKALSSYDHHFLENDRPSRQSCVNEALPYASSMFGAFDREYSPIISPLTFGNPAIIPEEDEEEEARDSCEEIEDMNEIDSITMSEKDEGMEEFFKTQDVLIGRIDHKVPRRSAKVDVVDNNQKLAGPLGKLIKQEVEKASVGSFEPEEAFMWNIDSDDQRANVTSDEDEVLQARAGTTEDDDTVHSSSALFSTSVPIRVPLSQRQNSRGVEILEDIPPDEESMAASFLALARSCHVDTSEIFGELPRPRVKTPRLPHASLGHSFEEPPLTS